MAELITDYPTERNALLCVMGEDESSKGWRVELLVEKLSEEKLLLCNSCNGLLRDACICEEELSCEVCVPEGVTSQPVKMIRAIVSEKMIYCPLKWGGCGWSDRVSAAVHHLEDCMYLPVACPLGCISLEGERKGKVVKIERRHIAGHVRDSCPLRIVGCEFCGGELKAREMNPHLEDCEEFPLPCPNGCSQEGEEGMRELKRKDIPVHLDNHCPLQKVQCPYWDHGCREEMERRHTDTHEREFLHMHFKLSTNLFTEKIAEVKETSSQKIQVLETQIADKDLQIAEINQKHHASTQHLQHELDVANDKIAVVSNELTEVKEKSSQKIVILERQMGGKDLEIASLTKSTQSLQQELDIANEKIATQETTITELNDTTAKSNGRIRILERQVADRHELDITKEQIFKLQEQVDDRTTKIETLSKVLLSQLPTGRLEWNVKGVKQKIQNKESTDSDPFYVGFYKCQSCIYWSNNITGVWVFICIMKGDFDANLHWPIRFRRTLVLINQIDSKHNFVKSYEVTKKDLEKSPECFQRPTGDSNDIWGFDRFISKTEFIEEKYYKQDSITLHISVEVLPPL